MSFILFSPEKTEKVFIIRRQYQITDFVYLGFNTSSLGVFNKLNFDGSWCFSCCFLNLVIRLRIWLRCKYSSGRKRYFPFTTSYFILSAIFSGVGFVFVDDPSQTNCSMYLFRGKSSNCTYFACPSFWMQLIEATARCDFTVVFLWAWI